MSARIADYLNALSAEAVRASLTQCCGAGRWVEEMARSRPFASDAEVLETAERAWWGVTPADWREAFARHPRIGQAGDEGRRRAMKGDEAWARQEQSGMATAAAEMRQALAEGNQAYERRFGHVFLICATGRSAEEMLAELRRRLGHDPARELKVAAGEQAKITRLRLEKLVAP